MLFEIQLKVIAKKILKKIMKKESESEDEVARICRGSATEFIDLL